jgi:hypothetical protein
MGQYVTRLEKIFKQLEKQAPWTKKEDRDLSKRDKVFVRNLQIKDKSSKKDAVAKYKKAVIEGPEKYKQLRNDTTSYVKELYPVHDKKIKIEEEKQTGKKVERVTNKEFKKALEKTSKSVSKRLKSARAKFPDASLFELRHGVNSKASVQYRTRNGRPDQYEGRILK